MTFPLTATLATNNLVPPIIEPFVVTLSLPLLTPLTVCSNNGNDPDGEDDGPGVDKGGVAMGDAEGRGVAEGEGCDDGWEVGDAVGTVEGNGPDTVAMLN